MIKTGLIHFWTLNKVNQRSPYQANLLINSHIDQIQSLTQCLLLLMIYCRLSLGFRVPASLTRRQTLIRGQRGEKASRLSALFVGIFNRSCFCITVNLIIIICQWYEFWLRLNTCGTLGCVRKRPQCRLVQSYCQVITLSAVMQSGAPHPEERKAGRRHNINMNPWMKMVAKRVRATKTALWFWYCI